MADHPFFLRDGSGLRREILVRETRRFRRFDHKERMLHSDMAFVAGGCHILIGRREFNVVPAFDRCINRLQPFSENGCDGRINAHFSVNGNGPANSASACRNSSSSNCASFQFFAVPA
jgi:hypothetical protein